MTIHELFFHREVTHTHSHWTIPLLILLSQPSANKKSTNFFAGFFRCQDFIWYGMKSVFWWNYSRNIISVVNLQGYSCHEKKWHWVSKSWDLFGRFFEISNSSSQNFGWHSKIIQSRSRGGGGCILKFNKHFQMFYFGWIFKPQELRKPAAFKFKIFDRFLDLPDRFFPFNSFCPETKLWTRH